MVVVVVIVIIIALIIITVNNNVYIFYSHIVKREGGIRCVTFLTHNIVYMVNYFVSLGHHDHHKS